MQVGAERCRIRLMAKAETLIRQSVSLPVRLAKNVHAIAKTRKTSANRVLVDLIEAGLQAGESEKERFFALTNLLSESTKPAERKRIKKELARITFGE